MRDVIVSFYRASRRLVHAPGFSLAVVLTLALGLAGVLVGYVIIDGVLLRPLPYPDSGRLVAVGLTGPGLDASTGDNSEATYAYYRKYNQSFQEMGAYVENVVSLSDGGEPEQAKVALVTSTVFPVLNVQPFYGRLFSEPDDIPSGSNVVLISYELWRRRYGQDHSIIGKMIELNRVPKKVVGILPPRFDFPQPDTEIWYPLGTDFASPDADTWNLKVIGRLAQRIPITTAAADLQRLVTPLREEYPSVSLLANGTQMRAIAIPLKDFITLETKTPLRFVFTVSGFVLLLVLANLSNLFFVRAEHRKPEAAVKRALGASRSRVASEFFIESVLLVIPAAGLALLIVFVGVHWRFGFEADQIPRIANVEISGRVIALTIGLLAGVSFFFGLISYLRTQRVELGLMLRTGTNRTVRGNERVQRMAIAVQVSIALMLLVGAIGILRSFSRLQKIPLGIEATGVVTGDVSLPFQPYPDYESEQRFFAKLQSNLASVPGIRESGAVSTLPLKNPTSDSATPVFEDGSGLHAGERNHFGFLTLVTPGYFESLKIPTLWGHTFESGDATNDQHPIVISESLSLQIFGTANTIGKRLRIGGTSVQNPLTIKGIVGNVPGEKVGRVPANIVYFPLLGTSAKSTYVPIIPRNMSIVVRSELPASATAASLREAVKNIDPKLPLTRVQTMSRVISDSTARMRLEAIVTSSAATIAFFLGLLGIYGVTAYGVSQRTREMGLRIALGAQGKDVILMVVRQTARMVLAGIAIGVLGALVLSRYLESVLFEVSVRDPLTLTLIAVSLFIIGLVASYIPARHASRADLMQALRTE
jgi:putative ABC transport system permease protein